MSESDESKMVLEKLYEQNFIVIGFYIPVFITAVVANILVIWIVIKDQYMRSVTNYFLVNLSMADLFVALVCMPNAAYFAYTSFYIFGKYICKLTAYFQCVSVASSIFTITTMALDRYLAITKPLGPCNRCLNKTTTIFVILLLWFLSFVLFLPIFLVTDTIKEDLPFGNITITVIFCQENWRSYFGESAKDVQQALGITWFILMFVIPGLVMQFAYSMMSRTLCAAMPPFDNNEGMPCMQQQNRLMRSRRRVACILLLLAFVFAACWLPYHLVTLLSDIDQQLYPQLKIYLLLLGHANSALNPIIYCALSRKFRKSIKSLICVKIHFHRRRQNMQQVLKSIMEAISLRS